MSSYDFNAFTGSFEKIGKIKGYKNSIIVDASFLTAPVIDLQTIPVDDTEAVNLNGLEIDSTNYTITGSTMTMVVTQLAIGDSIYVNYIGCS